MSALDKIIMQEIEADPEIVEIAMEMVNEHNEKIHQHPGKSPEQPIETTVVNRKERQTELSK